MNITKDIIAKLRDIDLSTEAAVVERYEALANSPLLVQILLHANYSEVKTAYQASRENSAVIAGVLKSSLREYATIGRTRTKHSTIKAIRRRIGLLFAEWEAEEKAGGLPASDGFIYAYAIQKGFNPQGTSLSEEDTEALDAVAEKIFTTIEAYVIYSLTGVKTAVDSILSHKTDKTTQQEYDRMREEVMGQMDLLFATEDKNTRDGLTNSFEEEVNFFWYEATSYAMELMQALATDFEQAAQLRQLKHILTTDKETASMKQAQETKYNEYIKANTPC